MSARSLAGWLEYIERQHPQAIALGLERVIEVFSRLEISISCPILTVGGTNGKGSTCAMLEAVLRSAGYRTGLYTSPHLLRYNERVRIGGREADEVLGRSDEEQPEEPAPEADLEAAERFADAAERVLGGRQGRGRA